MSYKTEPVWWLSDCGNYIAHVWGDPGSLEMDVMETRGKGVWLGSRYKPTGWEDTDPRYTHPEFPHMVTYFGQFTIGFADLDPSVPIMPFEGNAVLNRYTAKFSRRTKLYAKPKKNDTTN